MKLLAYLQNIYRAPYIQPRFWVLLCGFVLVLPWDGLSLWRYVYAFSGDLTPATLILFFVWLGFPKAFYAWAAREFPLRGRLAVFLGMLVFYVLSLGSWSFDPYGYGYQPWTPLLLLALWVAGYGRKMPGITLLLAVDMLVFSLHGLLSDNFWDYLLDPVLMLILGFSVIRGVMSARFKSTGQGR